MHRICLSPDLFRELKTTGKILSCVLQALQMAPNSTRDSNVYTNYIARVDNPE